MTVQKTTGTTIPDDLKARIRGALADYAAMGPEEGETWEGWYHAAFELAATKISRLLDGDKP